MSTLDSRTAQSPADFKFIRRGLDDFPYEPTLGWPWMEQHVGNDAWAIMLEECGETLGYLVISVLPDTLWVHSLYMLNGTGRRHDWALVRTLQDIAFQFGLRSVGFRSIRHGWSRVLLDRLGLRAEEVRGDTDLEYRIHLPLLGE